MAGTTFGAYATDIAYDSLSGATAHLVQTSGGQIKYNYAYQCFTSCVDPVSGSVSETISSLGDRITLAPNTGRVVSGMNIGFVEAVNSAAFSFTATVSIFSSPTTLQVTQTSGLISLPAVANSTTQTTSASIVSIGLGPFVLPDSFYYTIKINPVSSATVPTNFGLWLWDYYQDGTPFSIPVGTDLGNTGSAATNDFKTQVWGTVGANPTLTTSLGTNNTQGLSDGYTPAVTFLTVTPVPEPETYALFIAGLLAIGFVSSRSRRES